jgi:hypothetical protein
MAGQPFFVSASDLGDVAFQLGTTGDLIYIQAIDAAGGSSNWTQLQLIV